MVPQSLVPLVSVEMMRNTYNIQIVMTELVLELCLQTPRYILIMEANNFLMESNLELYIACQGDYES